MYANDRLPKLPEVNLPLHYPQALECRVQQVPVTVAFSSFPQNSHQSTFLTGYPFPNGTPSRSGLQESGGPPVTQSMARSEVVTSGNGSLQQNGEAFLVGGNTLNPNLSIMSPTSTHVPAATVDEPLNLDQNVGVVGYVLPSNLV